MNDDLDNFCVNIPIKTGLKSNRDANKTSSLHKDKKMEFHLLLGQLPPEDPVFKKPKSEIPAWVIEKLDIQDMKDFVDFLAEIEQVDEFNTIHQIRTNGFRKNTLDEKRMLREVIFRVC